MRIVRSEIPVASATALIPPHPKEIASILGERTSSQVVQVSGKKIVLYKENKDHKKINLPL